ncbi:MAG: Transposase [Candidatus Fermentimicrarchaeum limneticum]|uniref:Transposase n=1 Tax=Fermentimicrarchaeum limneticum TaxID=2795018 RepID=A0A7D5XK94_FERL1|nr:MAG: Transposase [Candidatus Fermentimicrarchaeum limneticum]
MMKTLQTVLEETPQQRVILDDTLARMSEAQNFVVASCYEHEETNTFRMHHFTYPVLRKKFGLPAQLAVVANKYACSAVKGAVRKKGRQPVFSGRAIHYDARSSSISLEKGLASLLTPRGRVKVRFTIPKYFQKFVMWKIKESNLVRCRDRKYRLMISIEKITIKSRKTGKVVGVDRGINNIIATSDGWLHDSIHVFEIKRHYVSLRGRLQSKGTPSARRHLKKLSGKEKRFMRDVNHCLSRRLIDSAEKDGVIVLENLKGVRNVRHRRKQNWLFSNWAFYQLEQFLAYKAEESGVAVEFIPARDTSKTCSICGIRGQRHGSIFRCKACGAVLNADLNAAKNILHRYTPLTGCCQPAYCNAEKAVTSH